MAVRLINAALDEGEDGVLILRGRLDPTTLSDLQVDDYQREVLPLGTINDIIKGFEKGGSVPDVDLGMRGTRTRNNKAGDYLLLDDVYIIDGLQRVEAARQFCMSGKVPRLGAAVHIGTDRNWEIERFRILNSQRTKVSANVLIRNLADKFPAVRTVMDLTANKAFPLYDRVSWTQAKRRNHLITARTLVMTLTHLHRHLGPAGHTNVDEMVAGMQKIVTAVGVRQFRENATTFFQLYEDCWGIRTVTYAGAPHFKATFLQSMAAVLSNHPQFWRENRLFVEMGVVRKLKGFNIVDPTVQQLAGSGGQARKLLYSLLVDHINSGKRTKRLVPRSKNVEAEMMPMPEQDETVEEEEAVAV